MLIEFWWEWIFVAFNIAFVLGTLITAIIFYIQAANASSFLARLFSGLVYLIATIFMIPLILAIIIIPICILVNLDLFMVSMYVLFGFYIILLIIYIVVFTTRK
jgi:hypothetical protein